jgi:hypothetical protein
MMTRQARLSRRSPCQRKSGEPKRSSSKRMPVHQSPPPAPTGYWLRGILCHVVSRDTTQSGWCGWPQRCHYGPDHDPSRARNQHPRPPSMPWRLRSPRKGPLILQASPGLRERHRCAIQARGQSEPGTHRQRTSRPRWPALVVINGQLSHGPLAQRGGRATWNHEDKRWVRNSVGAAGGRTVEIDAAPDSARSACSRPQFSERAFLVLHRAQNMLSSSRVRFRAKRTLEPTSPNDRV